MPTVDAYNQIPCYPSLYGQGLTLILLAEALAG
jgi:unsaturated rhamnogalacturonyl hydrolase